LPPEVAVQLDRTTYVNIAMHAAPSKIPEWPNAGSLVSDAINTGRTPMNLWSSQIPEEWLWESAEV